MSEPVLALEDLTIRFSLKRGRLTAVNGVSFEIMRGETFGLVGESGSGKTVTARSIMRLIPEPPGEIVNGRILFEGENVLEKSDREMRQMRGRKVAMVFQEPMSALNPVFTVAVQIGDALRSNFEMSTTEARARTVELLAMVGIPSPASRLDSYVHELSGGMRQRVMLAMALSCDPTFLIADEPTTALDVTIQAQILELMKGLSKRLGVALIVITHNLGVVARYADRVNVMYAGKIVESGTAADIYHNPRHPYTLGLLKSVPRLDQPRRARLDPIEGQPPDLTRLDDGCAFRPRCRFAIDKCASAIPPLDAVGDGHHAACWVTDRVAEQERQAS